MILLISAIIVNSSIYFCESLSKILTNLYPLCKSDINSVISKVVTVADEIEYVLALWLVYFSDSVKVLCRQYSLLIAWSQYHTVSRAIELESI